MPKTPDSKWQDLNGENPPQLLSLFHAIYSLKTALSVLQAFPYFGFWSLHPCERLQLLPFYPLFWYVFFFILLWTIRYYCLLRLTVLGEISVFYSPFIIILIMLFGLYFSAPNFWFSIVLLFLFCLFCSHLNE